MKKKTKVILSLLAALIVILIALPVLSPVVFTDSSEKGAMTTEI